MEGGERGGVLMVLLTRARRAARLRICVRVLGRVAGPAAGGSGSGGGSIRGSPDSDWMTAVKAKLLPHFTFRDLHQRHVRFQSPSGDAERVQIREEPHSISVGNDVAAVKRRQMAVTGSFQTPLTQPSSARR